MLLPSKPRCCHCAFTFTQNLCQASCKGALLHLSDKQWPVNAVLLQSNAPYPKCKQQVGVDCTACGHDSLRHSLWSGVHSQFVTPRVFAVIPGMSWESQKAAGNTAYAQGRLDEART